MKKKEQYIKIKSLSVSKILFDFINNELLKGIHVKKDKFWDGFDKAIGKLVPKNKKLLETRANLIGHIRGIHAVSIPLSIIDQDL